MKNTDDKTEIILAQWQTCVEMANSVSQRRDTMNNILCLENDEECPINLLTITNNSDVPIEFLQYSNYSMLDFEDGSYLFYTNEAINIGHFNSFCNTIEKTITATGIEKNISKLVFILSLLFLGFIIYYSTYIFLLLYFIIYFY